MKLKTWVKYLLGLWCLVDLELIVVALYMERILEIGGV